LAVIGTTMAAAVILYVVTGALSLLEHGAL
jgi:hypothetical protein